MKKRTTKKDLVLPLSQKIETFWDPPRSCSVTARYEEHIRTLIQALQKHDRITITMQDGKKWAGNLVNIDPVKGSRGRSYTLDIEEFVEVK